MVPAVRSLNAVLVVVTLPMPSLVMLTTEFEEPVPLNVMVPAPPRVSVLTVPPVSPRAPLSVRVPESEAIFAAATSASVMEPARLLSPLMFLSAPVLPTPVPFREVMSSAPMAIPPASCSAAPEAMVTSPPVVPRAVLLVARRTPRADRGEAVVGVGAARVKVPVPSLTSVMSPAPVAS